MTAHLTPYATGEATIPGPGHFLLFFLFIGHMAGDHWQVSGGGGQTRHGET